MMPRYKVREFMSSNRPVELRNKIDPRIVASSDESFGLKLTRYDFVVFG